MNGRESQARATPALVVELAGEVLTLLPEKAIWWPARHTLLIADAHFGKAASLRARGVPVPESTTGGNLAVLDALIARHRPQRILFLGDMLHAREAHAANVVNALQAWRARHATIELVLVEGNHDLNAGAPHASLRINVVAEPLIDGPFALCHHPEPHSQGYVLCGHLHPAYRLSTRSESVRLPCFWFGESVGVLPAFGQFTGAKVIARTAGDQVFVVAEERVFAVPA